MLKYVDTKVVFQEVPNEITLAISISGCRCNCRGCHSSYLAGDIGKPLNWDSLSALINTNTGITCICFMGHGDVGHGLKSVIRLAQKVKECGLKVALYSGYEHLIQVDGIEVFDYIKEGSYIEEKGPLNSKTTNQRMYKIENGKIKDITKLFWKHETEN